MDNKNNTLLTVVLGLFGRYEKLTNKLHESIENLRKVSKGIQLIVVADGNHWTTIPLVQMLPIYFKDYELVVIEEPTHLPAVLFNFGAEKIRNDYGTFLWIGCGDEDKKINKFVDYLGNNKNDFEVCYLRRENPGRLPFYPNSQLRYGWLQSERLYLPDEVCIKIEAFKSMQGFNPSPLLQKDFDREFALRLSLHYNFVEANTYYGETCNFDNYPFAVYYNISKNLIDRYITRCSMPLLTSNSREDIIDSFLSDIPDEDRNRICRVAGIDYHENKITKYSTRFKISILGGYWEYHHQQMAFFNYFEHIAGQGFATFKTHLEYFARPEDIADSDLVIFTRCRNANTLKIIDYCEKRNIPTIYMIDDNWIVAGKDYPELFGNMFLPGKQDYEIFIECIKKCTYTWIYSEVLEEDIRPYAKNIIRFKISIDPDFYKTKYTKDRENTLLIGYSGTPRWTDSPFQALARISSERRDIKILIFGELMPEQEALFKGADIIKIGFMPYPLYCRKIAELSPDLLLAPLALNRSCQSKCYNKYVESAACGAVCIFTKTKPYIDVIEDRENGFLIEGDSTDEWYRKINEVISDIPLLRKAQQYAVNDVMSHYTVEILLDEFVVTLQKCIKESNNHD